MVKSAEMVVSMVRTLLKNKLHPDLGSAFLEVFVKVNEVNEAVLPLWLFSTISQLIFKEGAANCAFSDTEPSSKRTTNKRDALRRNMSVLVVRLIVKQVEEVVRNRK